MHVTFELRAQTFSHSVHELAILPELAHMTSHLTIRTRNTQIYRPNNKFEIQIFDLWEEPILTFQTGLRYSRQEREKRMTFEGHNLFWTRRCVSASGVLMSMSRNVMYQSSLFVAPCIWRHCDFPSKNLAPWKKIVTSICKTLWRN